LATLEAHIRSFAYPNGVRPALRDVHLCVHHGEFVVVLGSAGAGKTTLCYCLTGVIPHHVEGHLDGDVLIDSQNLATMRLPEIATRVGFVLQSPENQLFNLTVYDDVSFGPENLCLPVAEVRHRAREALSFVGLLAYAGRNPDTLSGGQAQRAVLASILAMPSEIYVLDQPVAELDPSGRRQVYESIARLNRSAGKTVILVEDRIADIAELASRMVLLHEGTVVYDEPPAQFLSRRDLEDFGIRVPAPVRRYRVTDCPHLGTGCENLRTEPGGDPLPGASKVRPKEVAAGGTEVGEVHPTSGAPNGEVLMKVENLHYQYPGGIEALRGISFEARAGELIAILGENGAGKTTLAKHLMGLLKPTAGTVNVAGVDTRFKSVAQISKTVGFLFQDPDYQIFSVSVFEEVAFGLRLRGLSADDVKRRAMAALERVRLEACAELHPYRLSRGQRQKLALASVLALEPRVLVVDEPSTGLDYRETQQVMEILCDHARSNLVIMVTHDVEMALRYASRVVVMAGGRVLLDVPAQLFYQRKDMMQQAGLEIPAYLPSGQFSGSNDLLGPNGLTTHKGNAI
jgi:energy-coupling factor transporter ATP-binding protein EcfA2